MSKQIFLGFQYLLIDLLCTWYSSLIETTMFIAHEKLSMFESISLFTSSVYQSFGVLIKLCPYDQLWRGIILL